MAIDINEFKLPMSVQEARNFLQQQTDNFGVFFDVDRCYEIAGILQMENAQILQNAADIAHMRIPFDNKDATIKCLIQLGVSPAEFRPKGAKKDTFNEEVRNNILNNMYYGDVIREVVKYQARYTSNKRNKGNIINFALLPNSKALSKYGHRMSVGNPTWSILNTSRIAASDPGVQGIPRTCCDILTEPKGYTLYRCDSGQIEPRINFSTYLRDELIMHLIMYYNDAYYGILHFCQMTEEEEKACREDFEKNFRPFEITDEIKETRQNIKHLTNAGSYGSSNLDDINPVLAKVYDMKIVKHPARLALERKVTQDVERGVETFYGMFGTPVTPDETDKYSKEDAGWKGHLIRCGINNPVQTTASELMLFSINRAREVLAEAVDTHVCFYKHDEAAFYVSDEDMARGIGEKLKDVTAYNVKGWIPIESDGVVGVKKGEFASYIL